jgi:putative addiction module killer protein
MTTLTCLASWTRKTGPCAYLGQFKFRPRAGPFSLYGKHYPQKLDTTTEHPPVSTRHIIFLHHPSHLVDDFRLNTQNPLDSYSFINENESVYEIRHYLTRSEHDVFIEWRRRLRDTKAKIALDRRINRMELGNFGDHKFCRDGVWEMRIDVGPGYRVYYGLAGTQAVLLLTGGDKQTQDSDISRACAYWLDWQERIEQ